MRTIKFKAKRIDNGKWVYGTPVYYLSGQVAIFTFLHPKMSVTREIRYEVDPQTVCQFTGLYDKDGKEIYEHDIVEVDCSGVAGSFEDGTYKVSYFLPDCAFCLQQMDEQHGISFNECYIYTVIGNIYDKEST